MSGKKASDDFKKILYVFLYLLMFMVLWGAILFSAITILDAFASEEFRLWVLLSLTAAVFISFLPFFNFIMRRIFCYPGVGEPLSINSLRNRLMEVNNFDIPVMVVEKGKTLVVTWRYVDVKWWEVLAKAGLKKIYELHIKFHEHKKEVLLIDVLKDVSWSLGPGRIKATGGLFRGIVSEVAIGKQWGIKENFRPGKIYDYSFNPDEVRNPIVNEIIRSGWSVRLSLW